MLSLKRIFLHNWHRFAHHTLEVTDSLYLAGHNGSGKSSVLDALQLVLVADLAQIRFNSSAQERSQRTLDSYVRGKIGEGRYLRPGNTVAYVALAFGTAAGGEVVLGCCIEAGEGKSSERSFFILQEPLDPSLFLPEGRPLSRTDLKKLLNTRRGARYYTLISEYREDLLNRLGGLNPRFFDLFLRALTFQPIRDIRSFVEQWLLEAAPLDIKTLQGVVENLSLLRVRAQEVETQITALHKIVERQAEVKRLKRLEREYTLLAALLSVQATAQELSQDTERAQNLTHDLTRQRERLATLELSVKGLREAEREADLRLRQSDVIQRQRTSSANGRV